jgi:UDP-N-acetylmuramoylalanine--D-glutamate ligase
LSNDAQVFLEACPTPHTLGITGSAGKTTTTTLVGRMLALTPHPGPGPLPPLPLGEGGRIPPEAGWGVRVWVGGNIGNPLIADVARMMPADLVVLELSSFQLEIMRRSPRLGAILNITPNHLDRHGTMETYIAAKANLLRHQPAAGVAVLGLDDATTRALAPLARGRLAWFSGGADVSEGTGLRGEQLFWRWDGREHAFCTLGDIALRGRHNVLNVLAAGAISGAALSLAGADAATALEAMRAGLAGFTGVEHRLEFVREWHGARWYNDSIASAPERVIAALRSFDEPIVLLLGGRDKKLPWHDLARLVRERVRHAVLFGEAGPLIESALQAAAVPPARVTRCGPLREAVALAAGCAARGDVVLLSPGCTSFDEFKDFAERGERFKAWVRAL